MEDVKNTESMMSMTNAMGMLEEKMKEKMNLHGGVMKTSQLYEECSLDYRGLDALVRKGLLTRIKNGYYSLNNDQRPEEEIIHALFPDGVLCLNSALYYYGYIKERPFEWHIAIDKNTSKSRFLMEYPVVVPYYTEPRVLEIGVCTIPIHNVEMKIYDKDRMICDVLKYEHKIDHEVFKEGLRSYISDPEKNTHNLLSYAKERKVSSKVQSMIGVWL